jgi:hypothetical protein
LAAVVARPMRRATVTCPRPRPPSLKHSPTARVLWEKKVGSLRSASPPTGELLISLPVEQQLQELKPNGSNSGNRKIPTLSSCRRGRRKALRSTARDAAIRPLGFSSLPGGLVAGAPCIRVNEASGAVIRGDPKHRWPARPHSVSGLEPPSLFVLESLEASAHHRVHGPGPYSGRPKARYVS